MLSFGDMRMETKNIKFGFLEYIPVSSKGCCLSNGHIIIIGGQNKKSVIEIDTQFTAKTVSVLENYRINHSIICVEDKVYIFGGNIG